MAPLIKEFQKHTEFFKVKVCLTGQHQQMTEQINQFFNIRADFNLNIMTHNQTLFDITSRCLLGLKNILDDSFDLVFVQGDTTSVMAGALAAFYKNISVAHIEAGLRTGNKRSPFPEEMNRIIAGHIADYHFAPTDRAVENLKNEGITRNVYMVGNTVIDALHLGLSIIKADKELKYYDFFSYLDFSKKIILTTGHRRESFGDGFENICSAIASIAGQYKDVQFVYPMHLNPNVREPVNRILKKIENVFLIEPLDYPFLIWIMNKAYFILTDSGGIQEEAPALAKPVLVLRKVTERQEGIDAGTSKLVGTEYEDIVAGIRTLLEDELVYNNMASAVNPYGDGNTSCKIIDIVTENFK